MHRRAFLAMGTAAALASCSRKPDVTAFELDELTIDDLGKGLREGKWTCRELTELYLQRITDTNRAGPALASVLQRNPDALAIADQLDNERKNGKWRGPLHGIPILLKDNIDTADKMNTSAGSLALANSHPAKDAFIVARLRAAGVVLLGKTNMSEWANFRSTHSTSGWSARGGQTRNPYVLNRNPSGSSSGSAVAVAANQCAAAVGTETDGSIVSPASVNCIVGLKPTVGLVSRSGIIPIAHSQDTAGPMTRTVRDAALLLSAMAGHDDDDPATAASAGHVEKDYTSFLHRDALQGARLGVARKFYERNQTLDTFLTSCVVILRRAGALITDPADLPSHGKYGDEEGEVLRYEFKADLNKYLGKLANPDVRNLSELIAYNEKNHYREMPHFDQEIFVQSQAKGTLADKEYLNAREKSLRLARQEGIDAAIAANKLDAIVTLTTGPASLTDLVNGDPDGPGCSSPAAIAGYPHITVPAGFVKGLPVGLSFFGPAWSEPVLLRLAFAFEAATMLRRKPQFLADINA